MGSAWHARGARRSLGRRARPPRVSRGRRSSPAFRATRRRSATAVARHPTRFVGFFMFNPAAGDARVAPRPAARGAGTLRVVALFPAMHRYRLDDPVGRRRCSTPRGRRRRRVRALRRADRRRPQEARPAVAVRSPARRSAGGRGGGCPLPAVPVIIPHFGAGFFREALMAADQCANIHLDTSSSNGWMKYYPGLTLDGVFRQALAVAGPERLLFGTDSSFFPRGWQKPVYERRSPRSLPSGRRTRREAASWAATSRASSRCRDSARSTRRSRRSSCCPDALRAARWFSPSGCAVADVRPSSPPTSSSPTAGSSPWRRPAGGAGDRGRRRSDRRARIERATFAATSGRRRR